MGRSTGASVMEGSASAFPQCRRNREYPSFSSALLEEISRSTDNCTVKDEKINRRRRETKFSRDSSLEASTCKSPHSAREGPGIEIGILKYFHGYVDRTNRAEGTKAAVLVDKKKANREKVDLTRASKVKETAKQPMSPGRRFANFLNSLFTAKRKSKRVTADHDHGSGSVKCQSEYKFGENEKAGVGKYNSGQFGEKEKAGVGKYNSGQFGEKEKAGLGKYSSGQFGEKEKAGVRKYNSVSVCSMSSMTSNCTSTASTTPTSSSSRLHHYQVYSSNPGNVSKIGHTRYDEFSFTDHASSCHDPKQLQSSFVNPKNDKRRHVKFYPTSTLLEQYARPCAEKDLNNRVENYNKHSLPFPSKHLRRVQFSEKGVIPSEYLRCHQDRKYSKKLVERQEDENGDFSGSDSSSDLFELQSLKVVDIDIYSRELPVYETTNLETNRAIAKGLL